MNHDGWFGEESAIMNALRVVNADRCEDGKFKIYNEGLFTGLDGGMVVPGNAEYSVNERRCNLAALLRSTSSGIGVKVF